MEVFLRGGIWNARSQSGDSKHPNLLGCLWVQVQVWLLPVGKGHCGEGQLGISGPRFVGV